MLLSVCPQIYSRPGVNYVDRTLSGDKTSRADHIDSLIYTSVWNELRLRFYSDNANPRKGFSVKYEEGNCYGSI